MNKPKIVEGMILYSLNVMSAVRHHKEQKLTPVRVMAVGRKYFGTYPEEWYQDRVLKGFQINSYQLTQFHIEDWKQKTDYSATEYLYTSEKEWEDECLVSSVSRFIWNFFDYGHNPKNVSIDDLLMIRNILMKYEK